MKQKTQLRIFVVGCSRSGTTFLQSLLAAHPQLISFPESGQFLNLGRDLERRIYDPPQACGSVWKAGLRRTLLRVGLVRPTLLRGLAAFLRGIGRDDLAQKYYRWTPFAAAYARQVVAAFDQLAAEEGAIGWIEKTPMHLHYIDEIERFMPEAKFLHIVRSAEDNIASIWDAKQKYAGHWEKQYPELSDCADRWRACVRDARAQVGKPNHAFIRYGTLVEQTEAVLRRAFAFFGMDYDPVILTEREQSSDNVIKQHEPWKARTGGAIEKVDKFSTLFTPEEQEKVRRLVSDCADLAWLNDAELH